MSALRVGETVAAACLSAEFLGYWLHVLLHSEKIEFLSRSHMIHHLTIYPPNGPQRPSQQYLPSTMGRAALLGVGLEWLLPVGLISAGVLLALRALHVPGSLSALFLAVALCWGTLMFWYMHDAMHLRDFWMERHPLLRRWFLRARRRHDIHHMDLGDDGRMPYNFGICFFLFDSVFGTLKAEHSRFNAEGLKAAKRRYAYIVPMEEVTP